MNAARPSVAIVGGGLAGLAAAAALAGAPCRVTLLEARRQLGGRATSFRDPRTGEVVDHCQHVSMGCCTNLASFCDRTGIADKFRRFDTLLFIGPDGREHRLRTSRFLPAPFHLTFGLLRLSYLSLPDRLRIGRTLWRLVAKRPAADEGGLSIYDWLVRHGQTPAAIKHFWDVVLVSALGEETRRASVEAARHVFRDGFLASRKAFELYVPEVPLGELYGQPLEKWFSSQGIELRLATSVKKVEVDEAGRFRLEIGTGGVESFDIVVVAVTWRRIGEMLGPRLRGRLKWLAALERLEASPISGVHLWFDRPITRLAHAVLIGRLSQWVFSRGRSDDGGAAAGNYYQVVISASRELEHQPHDQVIDAVCEDLRSVLPGARDARLLHARVVTDPVAIFSAQPGIDALRPAQQTDVPGFFVAGDWTATGWPATMEGAVLSGHLAAEGVLEALGVPRRVAVPGLKRSLLARLLFAE